MKNYFIALIAIAGLSVAASPALGQAGMNSLVRPVGH